MIKKILTTLLLVEAIFAIFFQSRSVFSQDICSLENPCEGTSSPVTYQEEIRPQLHGQKVCVYYFWGAGCRNCQEIKPLVEKIEKKYKEKTEFKKFEVYFNPEGRNLFWDFAKRYKVKDPGVPAAFLGNVYLGGRKAIEENLEDKINEFYKNVESIVCPLGYKKQEGKIETPKNLSLTLPVVILAAATDSINPCAFAVLIFLLAYLLALKAGRRILKVGLTYIAVVFIVYFLAGLGLLTFIQMTSFGRVFIKIAAAIAIISGLINIKDFFWYGKGITLKIPESKKQLIEKYIHKASIPAAVILGLLVSAFELPCTGGIYLAILSLLADKATRVNAIPYLLLYNFIFVLPLFIILFVVYKGVKPEKLEAWRKRKRKWIRLVMGLVMLGLGVWLLK